jgi:hypothetical protein
MELDKIKAFLPPVIIEIAEIIGYESTQELVSKMGGVTFSIVRGVREFSQIRYNMLINVIGEDKAKLLIERFNGEEIYIPSCVEAFKNYRCEMFLNELKTQLKSGKSLRLAITELCPRFEISDRTAWRLLARENLTDADQHCLF